MINEKSKSVRESMSIKSKRAKTKNRRRICKKCKCKCNGYALLFFMHSCIFKHGSTVLYEYVYDVARYATQFYFSFFCLSFFYLFFFF